MNTLHYAEFDIHQKTISFCVNVRAGETVEQGVPPSRREAIEQWRHRQEVPWQGALGTTLG